MTQSDITSKPLKFVSGLHRSGTTWIGQMIEYAMPGSVVHEPLNAHAGLTGVNKWYYGPAEKVYVTTLLNEMLHGRRTFRRRRCKDSALKNLARAVGGSRYERALTGALLSDNPIVLKDPFLIRLGVVMVEAFDAKGVIMVRHPAALINSLRRMGWALPDLDGLDRGPAQKNPELQFAFDVGRFWATIYSEVERQVTSLPDYLLIVRHEDMCIKPVESGLDILAHLGIAANDAALNFLRVSTSGEAGEMSGKQLHNMHRDAKTLASSWRRSLTGDQIKAIEEGAWPVLQRFYPE